MMSPLFNLLNGKDQQANYVEQMFGGLSNFQQQLQQFASRFQNQNPQAMVQNLLNSGQMTQQQFEQYRAIANQITGRRF